MPWFLVLLVLLWSLPAQAAALREQDALELVAAASAQHHQVARSQVEIQWVGPRLASMLPPEVPADAHLVISGKPRLLGRTSIPVALMAGAKRLKTLFLQLDIQVYQEVLVANRTLRRGATLDAEAVRVDRRSLDRLLGSPLTDLEAFEGAVARRDIQEGTPLSHDMFELPDLVRPGSLVQVRLVSGELRIMTQGKAVTGGGKGQLVTVLNPSSRKSYMARVVGPDLVEVRMEDTP